MDPKAKLESIKRRAEQVEARKKAAADRAAAAQRLAVEAEAALESPALQRAFGELRALYTEQWRRTKAGEAALREDAWNMLRALDTVEVHLRTQMQGGKVASSRSTT